MKLSVKTPPIYEPVSLDEAKAYLRVSSDNEDSFLISLVSAARTHVEAVTGRSLMKQELVMEVKPPYPTSSPLAQMKVKSLEIKVPRPPLIEVQSVKTHDIDVPFTIHGDTIFLSESLRDKDLTITYWAGFGEYPEKIPSDLKLAVLMATRFIYEGTSPDLRFLEPYKVYRLG